MSSDRARRVASAFVDLYAHACETFDEHLRLRDPVGFSRWLENRDEIVDEKGWAGGIDEIAERYAEALCSTTRQQRRGTGVAWREIDAELESQWRETEAEIEKAVETVGDFEIAAVLETLLEDARRWRASSTH